MKILSTTLAFVFGQLAFSQVKDPIQIGHIDKLKSKILLEERLIEIGLPNSFQSEPGRRYPLVIVLDGGDRFVYTKAFLDSLTPNFFPEMVVVGIPNTDRLRDIDVRVGKNKGAEKFSDFLENELIPYMQNTYRTSGYNILMGHSLAGLFCLNEMLKGPSPFQAAIATSPSVHEDQDKEALFSKIRDGLPKHLDKKFLYFCAGGQEPEELHTFISNMQKLLQNDSSIQLKLGTAIYKGEGHFPNKGFYDGMRMLFSDWSPPYQWFYDGTLKQLKDHYLALSKKMKMTITPPSDLIWALRNRLEKEHRTDELIEATRYHIDHYPTNTARYIALANLLIENDKKTAAIQVLRIGLERNPSAKDIVEALNSIIQN